MKCEQEIEYISVYTDDQAVEDGILMDISSLGVEFQGQPVNRITTNLYNQLAEFFVSKDVEGQVIEFKHTLETKLGFAYYKGDIWQLPPGLWLMENELEGWTLMLPEDY